MVKPDYNALQSAALMAIEKTCSKFSDRDLLADGSSYVIDGELVGSINGESFFLPINSTLTVGHKSIKATSTTPAVVNIIAALLGKMNAATRAKAIADILIEYDESQDVTADAHLVELADSMLATLRQSKQVESRGAVKVNTASRECGLQFEGDTEAA